MAVAAVTDIAVNARHRPVPASAIALRQNVPDRHLERVLQVLVHSGILTSTRGIRGSYQLGREPNLICVDEIVRALSEEEGACGGPQSLIETDVVIPALQDAETALSETLLHLTIDRLARAGQAERL